MTLSIAILYLLITSTASLLADEIVVNNIKFKGDAKQVADYREACIIFKAKEKIFDTMSKGYTNGTATIEEYGKAQREFVAAREKMFLLELALELIPTTPRAMPNELAPRMMQPLFNEARKISDRLQLIKQDEKLKNDYESKLKTMLVKCHNHPAEGMILIALGELHSNSYNLALSYFSKATQCVFPSDRWDFAKQSAWKHLARLYEQHKEYDKAIEALKQWKISEPCGTGAGASRVEKKFWIWRLSLHTKGFEAVKDKMWEAIADGEINCGFIGEKRLIELILSIYKGKTSILLADIDKAVDKLSKSIPKDEYDKYRKTNILQFLKKLKKQDRAKSIQRTESSR